ncbi:hypothetical protein [Mesorhizobium sp. f-mel]
MFISARISARIQIAAPSPGIRNLPAAGIAQKCTSACRRREEAKTGAGSAERRIYALAAQHSIVAERLPLDDWADQVARLSDAEVPPDPVADLVVTLRRKGIVTDWKAAELYGNYLHEVANRYEAA